MKKLGVIHPGEMGISVAASAQNSGIKVCWTSENRSPLTHARAQRFGLTDHKTIDKLCQKCDAIISVCPPHAAEQVARQVAQLDFKGLYIDANAISPAKTRQIAGIIQERGGSFVDAGIIGAPAWQPNATWLYLSGGAAGQAAAYFAAGTLETEILGDEIGAASALKICFAAYSKGTTALITAIFGAAEEMGVRAELERHWSRNGSTFAEESAMRTRRVTKKAWRFSGEMAEIASAFEVVGMPGGFHLAAQEIYQRLAQFKENESLPELPAILTALTAD